MPVTKIKLNLAELRKVETVPGNHLMDAFDESIERPAVVFVADVSELMDHHIVDGRLWIGHEPPGKMRETT